MGCRRSLGAVSNDEAAPTLTAERVCVDEAIDAGVELLLPREVPLGGPRGIPVFRTLPNKHRHMVGPWCFADAFGPVDLAAHAGMDVRPHPHTGLQTVSWLVSGRIEHRDSLGSVHTVEPGGVHVMTAGRGIAHSEYSTADSRVLHGIQLWTALPAADRGVAPQFAALDAVPHERVGDADVRVFAGSLGQQSAGVPTFSPLVGAEVSFPAGGAAELPVDATFEHGVLALTDGIRVRGIPVASGGMGVVAPGTSSIVIEADPGAICILLGGTPWTEEFVMFWNFIGASHAEVQEARETWMRERGSDASARQRFGSVAGDANEPLPSPRLPDVELLPRGRAKRR